MDWPALLQSVQRFGLEYVFKRFYGVYPANVTDVRDPERRGRVRALVPAIGAREPSEKWFTPSFHQAGSNRGAFFPPNPGDSILVTYENGDPSRPAHYFGGWFGNPRQATEVPSELGYDNASPPSPRRFGYVSRTGHAVVFNETSGQESVEVRWHQMGASDPARTDPSKTADRAAGKTAKLHFQPDGSVVLSGPTGAAVTLDATGARVVVADPNGNTVTMDSAGVVVDASGGTVNVTASQVNLKGGTVNIGDPAPFSAVLGEKLMTWLASHVHGSGTGPTSPPVVPPTNLLSTTIHLKG